MILPETPRDIQVLSLLGRISLLAGDVAAANRCVQCSAMQCSARCTHAHTHTSHFCWPVSIGTTGDFSTSLRLRGKPAASRCSATLPFSRLQKVWQALLYTHTLSLTHSHTHSLTHSLTHSRTAHPAAYPTHQCSNPLPPQTTTRQCGERAAALGRGAEGGRAKRHCAGQQLGSPQALRR